METWEKRGILEGEKPLPYLKRHIDLLNYILSKKTRKGSGISDIHAVPIVVLCGDWIETDSNGVLKQFGQSDTFGRWTWDSNYNPSAFLAKNNRSNITGNLYADTFLHELLYNPAHWFNYFSPDLDNWNTNKLPQNLG